MRDQPDLLFGRAARRLRLDTLVKLRWLAVLGQLAAIIGVHAGLGFPVPLAPCLFVVSLSVMFNLVLTAGYPVSHRLSDRFAFALLAFDVLQLAALLFLTGGLENPFAILFLAPVLISATALPPPRQASPSGTGRCPGNSASRSTCQICMWPGSGPPFCSASPSPPSTPGAWRRRPTSWRRRSPPPSW
jgi:hypothetical protein